MPLDGELPSALFVDQQARLLVETCLAEPGAITLIVGSDHGAKVAFILVESRESLPVLLPQFVVEIAALSLNTFQELASEVEVDIDVVTSLPSQLALDARCVRLLRTKSVRPSCRIDAAEWTDYDRQAR